MMENYKRVYKYRDYCYEYSGSIIISPLPILLHLYLSAPIPRIIWKPIPDVILS